MHSQLRELETAQGGGNRFENYLCRIHRRPDEAQIRLQEFDDKWGTDYPTIVKSWRSNWARITPYYDLC